MEEFKVNIHNKEAVIRWLDEIRLLSGDATALWMAVTPKIIEFVDCEFHPTRDTHKLWPRVNVDYLIWKIKKYHVSGIGNLTGNMMNAASKDAIKKYSPRSLLWQINSGKVSEGSKNGYDYSKVFHFGTRNQTTKAKAKKNKGEEGEAKSSRVQKPRPIYKYTALRLNSFLKFDVKKFNDGTKHNSFTYNWLKKSLEKQGY